MSDASLIAQGEPSECIYEVRTFGTRALLGTVTATEAGQAIRLAKQIAGDVAHFVFPVFVSPSGAARTTEGQPDAWQIVGAGRPLGVVHLTEKSAQEHVRELNTNPQSRGGSYTYRALYAVVPSGGVSEDAKDAERYRFLRGNMGGLRTVYGADWLKERDGATRLDGDLDAAMAIARSHEAR